MVLRTCDHFEAFFNSKEGFDSYKIIERMFVGAHPSSKRKHAQQGIVSCMVCHSTNIFVHTCLHCIHFGCVGNGHLETHAKEKQHYLAVQLKFGFVHCFKCNASIYSDKILQIVQKYLMPGFDISKLREKYKNRVNQFEEADKHGNRMYVRPGSTLGLRGLLNLGNTCFMNCIVQTLMHAPVFKEYFLSDKHATCDFDGGSTKCVVCELSNIFQEFYSGKKSTLLLHQLLYLIWMNARHLAGYEQQDAHEFFIAILDTVHKHSSNTKILTDVSNGNDCSKPCDCIVDKIFTGLLQSDVVCQSCNSVSTTVEPFWDVSLNISASPIVDGSRKGGADSGGQILSLVDCLEQFTRAEHLGPGAKIRCNKCDVNQESTKQLTVNKLPIIICFHLKRFEHSAKFHKKISTVIQFPEELDMAPFTNGYRDTLNKMKMREKSKSSLLGSPELKPGKSGCSSTYSLFSVVNHHGSIDAGHYTSFIRLHTDTWYKCNDDIISKASVLDVLQSEGYLLFYHKQILEYE